MQTKDARELYHSDILKSEKFFLFSVDITESLGYKNKKRGHKGGDMYDQGRQPETLENELERRYGAAFMQDISDRLAVAREREAARAQAKGLDAAVRRARGRVRDLVREVRGARMEARLASLSGGAQAFWMAYESRFLGRQLQESYVLYRMAVGNYHAARRSSLERLFRIGLSSTRIAAG